jgi:hypothetical protein
MCHSSSPDRCDDAREQSSAGLRKKDMTNDPLNAPKTSCRWTFERNQYTIPHANASGNPKPAIFGSLPMLRFEMKAVQNRYEPKIGK